MNRSKHSKNNWAGRERKLAVAARRDRDEKVAGLYGGEEAEKVEVAAAEGRMAVAARRDRDEKVVGLYGGEEEVARGDSVFVSLVVLAVLGGCFCAGVAVGFWFL